MSLDKQWVLRWMDGCARVLEQNREMLGDLDDVIGDGDHGENISRGFSAVDQRLSGIVVESPKQALRVTANTLLAAVGGASGSLYGTAFLRAARSVGTESLDSQAVAMLLVKAAEGIAERGGAQPGDKTMLDAWYPAATNAAAAVAKGATLEEVLRVAADAAAKGAEDTVSMSAAKGRASLLGERSIGHKDPGATSSALILAEAAKAAAH
ncbi:dihydroxyacetone kinase subunit DhaL [Mobiluncus curtisii]|uniref:dihydroxyacetone kinase subunit DhaL n=1 Tax=Mobiluncus curtisii TaxID=2051 RepID=UPI00147018F9|nr:dihydroxyacetone kinase subunit L [Mobiluncus curtisii]NMW83026.1 dihydroxyacetone kinase subunit L [Mobiluncus curtisii]NMW98622.1 dihydroxyacetone kinase subunit L [Mobiluncus curtisii]NMX06035.1 dihydroxyacetone kinase subunit L [Mobiluncus curtisii]